MGTADQRSAPSLARLVAGRFLRSLRTAMEGVDDGRYRASLRHLAALRDAHAGERCFLIGNGPSLQRTDLTRLRQEVTFGLNRIYLLFKKIGFETTYHAVVNRLVLSQCREEIDALPMTRFTTWDMRDLTRFTPRTVLLRSRPGPTFYTDLTDGIWEGATVTYVALQIAYFMGFAEVVLVGVDHSFSTQGQPHAEVVSAGDDPDHFSPSYFGAGFRWNLPDLATSELAYRIAKHHFENSGRRILDATIGGRLTIFDKVNYDDVAPR